MGVNMMIDKNARVKIRDYEYLNLEEKSMKFTSIVILTYNQLEYTKICIESIRKFTNKDNYEIIIVDNNSTDGTVEWLKNQDNLTVIYNDVNVGFPAGCNQGIKIANGDNILLLNNDVIVTPNWLYNLNKALWSSEEIGAVGAVSNSCSYYQSIDVKYNNIDELLDFANNYNKYSSEDYWSYRTKLIGFCILIKKEVLNEIGLLDEIFTPGNFEDDDISFRMVSNGYKLLLCKDTFIHHFGSVSFKSYSEEYRELMNRNEKKFQEKWGFNSRYSNMIKFDLINNIENDRNEKLNILEVGCGTGATLLELKSRYKNSEIYGIEISEGASKISNNICNLINADIEQTCLPYEDNFFDYIILGDVLEHLNNPWNAISNLKRHLKKDGCIIASIPNIMHVSVMKNLIKGHFTYTDAGILDRTHLRFFTLAEVQKMFMNGGYDVSEVTYTNIGLSSDDEIFIDTMCKLYGEDLRQQYIAYQYIIKAVKGFDYSRYNNSEMIDLKYSLMRIDNELDIENSTKCIFELYNKYQEHIIDDISYLLDHSVINKEKVINKIAVKAFENGLFELSISILMLGLKINNNNKDIVYNICFLLNQIGEYKVALNVINNCDEELKKDIEISDLINLIEGNCYE